MPRRGYRKGISDQKEPYPHTIKSRATTRTHEALKTEAQSRSLTLSRLVAAILEAHVTGQRLELPHARGPTSAAIRELARLGNNLNQIARQANLLKLHLLEADARATIAAINAAVLSLGER